MSTRLPIPLVALMLATCASRPPPVDIADASQLAKDLVARADGLSLTVAERALTAYKCGARGGGVGGHVLTVIDYDQPSTARRLWVLDLSKRDVLFHELVAHGKNSGHNNATIFSNEPRSKTSSIGLFRTLATYQGKHGHSLKLRGLEPSNDNAERRSIVIHGADYVSRSFADKHGRLGRSWGCPALPMGVHTRIIDTIKDGTAVFVHFSDAAWLAESPLLHCDG